LSTLNISNYEKADKYIRGELQQKEIEELWKTFLQDQELFRYFMMQVQVVQLIKDVNAGKVDWPFKG
jgi:hypothetical protein